MTLQIRFVSAAAVLFLLGSICADIVSAQSLGRIEQTETNLRSYYHFAERGTATIKVFVIGTVTSPGIYEISDGTNLETLLVLAQPAANSPGGSGIGRQKMQIRLFRSDGTGRELLYEADLSEAIEQRRDHPVLQEGDLLMVEVKGNRVDWRDLLRIAQTLAVFGLAIDRLARRF